MICGWSRAAGWLMCFVTRLAERMFTKFCFFNVMEERYSLWRLLDACVDVSFVSKSAVKCSIVWFKFSVLKSLVIHSQSVSRETWGAVLKHSQQKKRFLETVEIQIGLKNYDPHQKTSVSQAQSSMFLPDNEMFLNARIFWRLLMSGSWASPIGPAPRVLKQNKTTLPYT